MHIVVEKIDQLVSASGWWVRHAIPVHGVSGQFEPLVCFAVLKWKPVEIEKQDRTTEHLVAPLTLGELDSLLEVYIPEQQHIDGGAFSRNEVYHESDFEIVGERLKPNVKSRTMVAK